MTEVKPHVIKVLEKIAEEYNFVNYEIKVDPICSGGANYSSTLYNVTIKEGGNTHYMFAKVAALGVQMRSHNPEIYKTEILAYTKLVNIFNRLQEEHQVPQKYRLRLTKFYGYNTTAYEEVLVLENLAMKGYQNYDRFNLLTWHYAVSALTELSKLHALSFAYGFYYSDDFNEVVDTLKFEWSIEKGQLSDYYTAASIKAIEVVQEKTRDPLKRFFETFRREKFSQYYIPSKRTVLAHLDFKTSNLMHKIHDDGTVEVKLLDLQTLQDSSPVLDLLYFIVTGSDEQFRTLYYEKLIDHYYNELHAAMTRLHLDPEEIYSRTDFNYELKEKLPYGLIIAVMTLPIVLVSTEKAPKVDVNMAMSHFSAGDTNQLYAERLNGIVNDYVKWGVLK